MAFRCGNCAKPQDAGTVPVRVVTETRRKLYDGGGRGWEIVKEKLLCKPCGETVKPDALAARPLV